MSYYTKPPYNFSDHGLQRCKERLHLQDKEDYEVKEYVYKLISQAKDRFEAGNDLYISAGNNLNLYFVINLTDNLIVTCTPMSIEKQIKLFN